MNFTVMKILSTFLATMLSVGFALAQYQQSIGTPFKETGRTVSNTFDSKGYIIGGNTDAPLLGNTDATLIKTTRSGAIEWSCVYGNSEHEIFNSVRDVRFTTSVYDRPDVYAAVGTTNSFGSGGNDMYFVIANVAGEPVSSKAFGKGGNEQGYCVQSIRGTDLIYKGYVLVGESDSYAIPAGRNVYVVKTDEFGNLTRATVVGGPGNESGYYVIQTVDLGFIIVGTTDKMCGTSIVNQDILVMRLDLNLNLLWSASYGGGAVTQDDVAYSVVENPDDRTITITGITKSFGVNNAGDAFLLNLKSTGVFNWMKTYGSAKREIGNSIHLIRNSSGTVEYVVGGNSTSFNDLGVQDPYVFKTDARGNLLWTNVYGNRIADNSDAAFNVAEIIDDSESGLILAGDATDRWTENSNDIYMVKMTINGQVGPCQRSVSQTMKANSVCSTSGATQKFVSDYKSFESSYHIVDYTVKKCDATAARILKSEADEPAMPLKEINKADSYVKIYNSNGELVTETKPTGDFEIAVDQLPKGFYIEHIINKDGVVVRKKLMKQ